jgi:hypothetical protein
MGRKTAKRGLKQLTAVVPKTFRATANLGRKTMKSINSFLNRTTGLVKRTSSAIDKRVAKSIRSITKKRGRK